MKREGKIKLGDRLPSKLCYNTPSQWLLFALVARKYFSAEKIF